MTNRAADSMHSYFYVDTVTFQVENCLFKVPREPFEQDSTTFCDKFSMPYREKNTVRGQCNEEPIQLDGVSKDDFEQFLKVLFHRKHALLPYLPNGISEWTSVLKLATTWGFKDTRQAAIDALNDSQIGLVDRVVLAQTYDIKDWLLPALNQLAQRAEPISLEEAGRIGVDVALKMTWVRERLKSTSIHHCSRCGSSDGNAAFSVSDSRDYAAQGFDYSEAIRTTLAL